MFSQKQANVLFATIMVGTMTFIMTGVNSFINSGYTVIVSAWLHNWIVAYLVALPIMMTLSPPLRRFFAKRTGAVFILAGFYLVITNNFGLYLRF